MPSALRLWLAGLVFGATVLPAAEAAAQDNRELERRVDEIVAQKKGVEAELAAYRGRPGVARIYRDTVAIAEGRIRIVTSPEFLLIARAAAPKADAFIHRRAGSQITQLQDLVFEVWADSLRRAQKGMILSPHTATGHLSERYLLSNATALARAIEEQAQWLLAGKGKPNVGTWLFGELPIDTTTNADWRALRLELISARQSVAKRCYAGNLRDCKVTLGLVVEADPTTTWYDSAARRTLVTETLKSGKLDRGAASRCMAGQDSDCVALLRTEPVMAQWASPPGSRRARMVLVQLALAMGGDGALERLAASADSPSAAIGAIARVPVDSVVAQWQRHAHDGGIESEIATPVIAITAMGWILIMGALSLRSPRWR
jgi:hypothetical protein